MLSSSSPPPLTIHNNINYMNMKLIHSSGIYGSVVKSMRSFQKGREKTVGFPLEQK